MSETPSAPDQAPATESVARPSKPAKSRSRSSIFRDPVVRVLSLIAAGVVVFYLITVVSALLMGVLAPSAPRTRVEKDLRIYETAIEESPSDPEVWQRYIAALIASGQNTAAQSAIDRGKKVAKDEGIEAIATRQAELYFTTGRYEEGIKVVDQLRARLKKRHEEQKKIDNTPEQLGAQINDNYWSTLLMKAEALVKLNDTKGALKAFDEYLKANAAAADVMVRRAQLRAETGDKKGAEADLRAALKYLPDDPTALEELKKIGVEE